MVSSTRKLLKKAIKKQFRMAQSTERIFHTKTQSHQAIKKGN
jgi:hypothetical protein